MLIELLLTSYIANMTPALLQKLTRKATPMDFNITLGGQRLLGGNKTWLGFSAGVIAGVMVGSLILDVSLALLISLGSMLGDTMGSFIKRRLDIPPGEPDLLLDSEPFILIGLLFANFKVRILPYHYLIAVVATPILHRIANIVGFKLKFKKVPW